MDEGSVAIKSVRARILVVTVHFDVSGQQPWLVDDLVAALARLGCEVDVIVGDAKRAYDKGLLVGDKGVRVVSVGSKHGLKRGPSKYWRHLATMARFRTTGYQRARRQRYDACIFFSTGLLTGGLPGALRRGGVCKRLIMILWDFFPVHQIEIGRLPRLPGTDLLRLAEYRTLRSCDVIAVMTPRNAEFLRQYHPKYLGRTQIIPPWTANLRGPTESRSTSRSLGVVFGGQLSRGRGLDTLLNAAAELKRIGSGASITVAGDGPERRRLESRAASEGLSNVQFVGLLTRARYRSMLSEHDVGVAATVPNVSIASFPSKIGEYCGAGIPVIVCTEASSDVGQIAEQAGWGLFVEAGDSVGLARAIRHFEVLKRSGGLGFMSEAALHYARTALSVDRAAESLLRDIERDARREGSGGPGGVV